jgi:trimethylamine corrinoid protein
LIQKRNGGNRVEKVLENLQNAIIEGNVEAAEKAAEEALATGIIPLEAIEKGGNAGMQLIGDRFANFEVFLPELILAGRAMNAALAILLRDLSGEEAANARAGKVVLGTVGGDMHDIGKNIVKSLLSANGFEVFDLGVDVNVKDFITKAREVKADIIGLSTLLTTSMPFQKDLVDFLRDAGLREQFFVIIGGGPVGGEWAAEIGADGYGRTAAHAAELCLALVDGKQAPLSEPLIFSVSK